MLWILLSISLAGDATIKGSQIIDGNTVIAKIKSQKSMGTSFATVTAPDGSVIVILSISPYMPGQAMLNADFQGLGTSFGGMVSITDQNALLQAWLDAGVITTKGADATALSAWAKQNNIVLKNTAQEQAALAQYAATHPGPTFSTPPSSSTSSSTSSHSSSSSTPSTPAVVSVQIHIDCNPKVRLFMGSSANSGGTYGWESYNTTRSTSAKPGSVICIADANDHVQTCWTVPDTRSELSVSCSGFKSH